MPRKVRDASLETRTARSRLKVRHKPYPRLIEPGLHLLYRKLTSGPGTWIVRRYTGEGRYLTENLRTQQGKLIIADDYSDADGVRVLSFSQAQELAKAELPEADKPAGPYRVNDACDDYLQYLRTDGRTPAAIRDAEYGIDAFIRPSLGRREVGEAEARSIA